ncbi:hypothetical protein [Micrococcus sp.]|uniref:hypothetical protein n=1 Tax=Micrococcus sp. TaxID=1271 RepID=UPI002A915938|nr:hypothetical protein [Micrococcus sp.]MDY6055129.1 hypothetical protein [Micrococcus sp.]
MSARGDASQTGAATFQRSGDTTPGPQRSGDIPAGQNRSNVARALGVGLAESASTLLPVSRLPRTTTALAVGGTVAVAFGAAAGVAAFRSPVQEAEDAEGAGDRARGPLAMAGMGLAAGAALGTLTGGGVALGLTVDAAIERALVRRGVRRPRVVMAVAAGVLSAAIELADAARGGAAGDERREGPSHS